MADSKRKVKLIINSKSKNDGSSIILLDGVYSGRGNLHCFDYAESGDDLRGTVTKLVFSNGHAAITREGTVNSKMEFYPDVIRSSYYETQYGSIYMEIETKHVSFRHTHTGYEGRISYKLFFGGDRNNSDERDMRIQVNFIE